MKTDGSEFNLNSTHFQINLMDQNSKYNTLKTNRMFCLKFDND
jgi:hypothetical protein